MIDILLPTYNGEKYIRQQVDSIIHQTYQDWRLIVRDDGSKDNTIQIVKDYCELYPKKIMYIEDDEGNKGTSGCLNILLKYVNSDYFMFCDQDDIWLENKIELLTKEMFRLERTYIDNPILVCSDASCINENNDVLCNSFFENQKFIDTTDDYCKLLALNVVQGSTTLMNKKVKEIIKYIPLNIYHDWWVAVNTAYYGKVHYVHKSLLLYRQHKGNVVGALEIDYKYLIAKILNFKKQILIYVHMYKLLSFHPSIIKWIYYKVIISMRRL